MGPRPPSSPTAAVIVSRRSQTARNRTTITPSETAVRIHSVRWGASTDGGMD